MSSCIEPGIAENSDYSQTNQFWTRKIITNKQKNPQVFRKNSPKPSIEVKIEFHSSLFPTVVTHVRHLSEKSDDSEKNSHPGFKSYISCYPYYNGNTNLLTNCRNHKIEDLKRLNVKFKYKKKTH